MQLEIAHTWNGLPLVPDRRTLLRLGVEASVLVIEVDAPFHDDPPPPAPPGSTERLWEHEVVELFLAGRDARYLEIELSPHGHHLVLSFHGIRQTVAPALPIDNTTEIDRGRRRWTGRAAVPLAYLPAGPHSVNAYAIHGNAGARQYEAAYPVPGNVPDFHQLDAFAPCELTLP